MNNIELFNDFDDLERPKPEHSKYITDGELSGGSCPVCGEYKDVNKNEETDKHGQIIRYKCNKCGFKWFDEFVFVYAGTYSENGNEIYDGEDVDMSSFEKN